MKKIFTKTKTGFTIIEVMVSISLFLVIVMSGMTALLNANLLSQKSRDMRSIMDSLNFAMEDMSKNLRTGYDYYCITTSTIPEGVQLPSSCIGGGGGISFKPQDYKTNNYPLIYYLGMVNGKHSIFKMTKREPYPGTAITPGELDVTTFSFSVFGAEPPNPDGTGDHQQPFVVIKLIGNILGKNGATTPFSLQTSVSQRLLDNK